MLKNNRISIIKTFSNDEAAMVAFPGNNGDGGGKDMVDTLSLLSDEALQYIEQYQNLQREMTIILQSFLNRDRGEPN